MAGATAADYGWFEDHWLREAFCVTLVRGLDEAEVLRRFGGHRGQPRPLTVGEAGELSRSFHAGYPQFVLAAGTGGWVVAVEDNGWEGWRPEALRALSRGTEAVSVFHNSSEGYFSYAADGALLVQFELLFPWRRWGGRPDLLVEQMRAVGLDPDRREPPHGELAAAALALADRITGVRLGPDLLDAPMIGAEIAPLLEDPPASSLLDGEDPEVTAAAARAAPGVLRAAAAAAAGQAVRLARLDHDPVVAEAMAAARAGQGREVGDQSALGRRIRGWGVEVRIAELVGSDPMASLDAQLRTANLLRAAGHADELPPLKDPSPWLGEARQAMLVRWRAGQAVRAALLADPRTGLSATLEALRHLPGDPWPELRATALAALRPEGMGSGSW